MTARVAQPTAAPPAARYQFNWEQDAHQRVFKLSGRIDAAAAARLERSIINLGSRRLVVDLSEVASLDPLAASTILHIVQRLGPGRVTVLADSADEKGLVITDLADIEALGLPV